MNKSVSNTWLCCGLALAFGCNKIPEPAPAAPPPVAPQPAALQQPAQPAQPEAAAPPPAAEQTIKRRGPAPGFAQLSLKDTLPICVFPNMQERIKAPHLADVKPQKLAANSKVTFGVFGPGCLNAACDDRPMLQCWTEQDGETIVVKTRFSSFHNDSATCTEECLELDTACDSQIELKAGKKYTVRHGEKTYKLQTGTVRDPCFGAK
jgi:hypothetical protein